MIEPLQRVQIAPDQLPTQLARTLGALGNQQSKALECAFRLFAGVADKALERLRRHRLRPALARREAGIAGNGHDARKALGKASLQLYRQHTAQRPATQPARRQGLGQGTEVRLQRGHLQIWRQLCHLDVQRWQALLQGLLQWQQVARCQSPARQQGKITHESAPVAPAPVPQADGQPVVRYGWHSASPANARSP